MAKAFRQVRFSANAAYLPWAVMFYVRRVTLEKFKVANPVIQRIAVFVMNYFSFFKWPSKMFGHHKTMFKNPSSSIGIWMEWTVDKFSRLISSGHRYTVTESDGGAI